MFVLIEQAKRVHAQNRVVGRERERERNVTYSHFAFRLRGIRKQRSFIRNTPNKKYNSICIACIRDFVL
jgi:hypothetical protein